MVALGREKKNGGEMGCGILVKFSAADRHQAFPSGMEEARRAHRKPRGSWVDQDWPWAQQTGVKF